MTGETLFKYEKNRNELKERILRGYIVKEGTYVSLEAADLINKMIKIKPRERITIKEALNHPWFKGEKLKEEKENDSNTLKLKTIVNTVISSEYKGNKLQQSKNVAFSRGRIKKKCHC